MKRFAVIVLLCALAAGCSRPPSYEPFVLKEKAEYGDTYSFILDLSDTTVTYSLDFFTRLERPAFGVFESDSIVLDLRWISPSDSILTDTTVIRMGLPVDASYYSRDFISGYSDDLSLPEAGRWRLKAKVVGNPGDVRGIGVIFKRL